MPDKFSKEIRRKTMQAVKSKNTGLEKTVTNELRVRRISFRKNVRGMVGTPDIVIKRHRIVIFVDSCFWHGCKNHYRVPETNTEYWQRKIERNRERDLKTTEYYLNNNWHILRIWEHEFKEDQKGAIKKIVDFINASYEKV
jgi:DNA mismatch endonuclease (patch repair protein)